MQFKTEIKRGRRVMGIFLSEIAHPNLVRLTKASGADFMVVDCEHGYFDYSQVAAIAAIGSTAEYPIIVRIPEINRGCIQKYLDSGVEGIWAPDVRTVEAARALVAFSKYEPLGKRGISTMRPHSEYNPGKLTDYIQKANDKTMVFLQIESREGADNLDTMLDIPGIDGVFVGPNDMACDLGHTGNFNTPDMEACIDDVLGACKKHHVPCGIVASNPDYLKHWAGKGMTMFSCSSELGLLKKGIQQMLKETDLQEKD